jgi:AraC-like DNA-binding protein
MNGGGLQIAEGANAPQKVIAQSLGYKEVTSFARVFRKVTGSTPGAYQKRFGLKGVARNDFAAKNGSSRKQHTAGAGIQPG